MSIDLDSDNVSDEANVLFPRQPITLVTVEAWRDLHRQIDNLEQRVNYLENLLRFHEHDGK